MPDGRQLLTWDLSENPGTGEPYIFNPGDIIQIEFVATIVEVPPEKQPIVNYAAVDYNDAYYITYQQYLSLIQASGSGSGIIYKGKHPPVYSSASFFPMGRPIVYPNPFNPEKQKIKFDNLVPNSTIFIYTISGEFVKTINVSLIRAEWDGKNMRGKIVSEGIYYFVIKNPGGASNAMRGKIFVVK